MRIITSSEFQNHVGKYLRLSQQEDVIIARNGTPIARLTKNLMESNTPFTDSLTGLIRGYENVGLDEIRTARWQKFEA